MAKGAAIKDKVDTKPALKDGSDAQHPLVPREDFDKHRSTIAAATKAKKSAPVVKDGKLDCSGDCCGHQAGDPKSTAQIADATMDDFEHRLPPATAKQIAGVYDATTKLLNDPEKTSPLSQPERNRLANDILSNAAQQHEIGQGMHNTCNVTTLEQTLNRESPDKAAALVADVGLKGYYESLRQVFVVAHSSDSHSDGPRVNRNEHMMTDDEYQKWRDKIKKEDPTDKEHIKHKPEVDIQALIAPLQSKLEAAKARKDDFNASLFDAQISILRNSQ